MPDIQVYATCPHSRDASPAGHRALIADVARWSEAAGCDGALVYTDNGILDPWLVAQIVIESTERLRPLVAVQPVYMHPYSVAKMVTSLAFLHGRRVDLNLLAGGFKNDLLALGDATPHDARYERTTEYARIVIALLAGETVSAEGRWHQVKNLRLTPPLPEELFPGLMISGSSPAGLAAADAIGALAVRYPKPVDEEAAEERAGRPHGLGVRVGVVARATADEAWRVARERFPEDRRGQIAHQLAMKVSDSQWHAQLSALEVGGEDEPTPYWLGPFNNGQSFCPYLVGSHDRVGAELARYVDAGFETFILDIPADEEELHHIGVAFRIARGAAA